jgi:hypothetical protein
MLAAHHDLAFVVVAVCIVAAIVALGAWRGQLRGGRLVAHALALAQTLVVAQALVGLLLLADHKRADRGEHYMYGSLAVLALAWPWLYAPPEPRRRLAWFAGATLLAAVLAVRAFMTA